MTLVHYAAASVSSFKTIPHFAESSVIGQLLILAGRRRSMAQADRVNPWTPAIEDAPRGLYPQKPG